MCIREVLQFEYMFLSCDFCALAYHSSCPHSVHSNTHGVDYFGIIFHNLSMFFSSITRNQKSISEICCMKIWTSIQTIEKFFKIMFATSLSISSNRFIFQRNVLEVESHLTSRSFARIEYCMIHFHRTNYIVPDSFQEVWPSAQLIPVKSGYLPVKKCSWHSWEAVNMLYVYGWF